REETSARERSSRGRLASRRRLALVLDFGEASCPALTKVPLPTMLSRYPSATSCSNTATTVPRPSPCCRATLRVEGSRPPTASVPATMAERSPSYSQRKRVPSVSGARSASSCRGAVLGMKMVQWSGLKWPLFWGHWSLSSPHHEHSTAPAENSPADRRLP